MNSKDRLVQVGFALAMICIVLILFMVAGAGNVRP